ncbi:DMT family transporter [bacterium SCSIO 12741]|nr:DMT family transporter [bacterium SCSIO 12741]
MNYTIARDVMQGYIQPFGFIFLRVIGALVLFWLLHATISREKIERGDWLRLIACGAFGVAANQLMFFQGLSLTSPINAAIMMTTNPVLVLLASAILLGNTITRQKLIGIGLGVCGAVMVITLKGNSSFGADTWMGDLLVFFNSLSYGIYLVIVQPLMKKYQPLTVIKWVFTFGFLFVFPFGIGQFSAIEWETFTWVIALETAFVVVCTTFFAYLLNIFALKNTNPSTVSVYIYSQPILAALFAISLGKDSLDWIKIVAALLIFSGVFLVSRKFS